MSFFGKLYTLQKDENFDDFLKALGLPEDQVQAVLSEKTTVKLAQNGDSYVLSIGSSRGTKDVTFKSGVEFDDVIGPVNTPVKNTITVDGNKLVQKITGAKGTTTFQGEFNGDEFVTAVTSEKFSGVAKRYFKA